MIRFDHVSKHYPGHRGALSDVTVDIADGEFVYLIGPSGAGKTTMLRLIMRDLIPTSGTVLVDKWKLSSIPSSQIHHLRRHVRTVYQDFKLLADRTVYENVAVGLEVLGKNDSEIVKDVMKVLSLVTLADKYRLFPLQLSAGEQQRVSIARAIVGGPKILLADEPTGNLDPDTAGEILDILEEVNSIGTTVIMATHNASLVNERKKRTLALDDGSIHSDEARGRYRVQKEKHANA
ncbi:cell division ATP-binding protein FtsE [Candidatus Gottesmanbacteria bacterium]|nr:cell division ATP-binding protein FtsE [Candidatus Gottesmanbacteria bacterium]